MGDVLSLAVSRDRLDAKMEALRSLAGPEKDKFLKAQGPGVIAFVKETFVTSGSNAGVNWPPSARGGEPLRDNGVLMRSFAAEVDSGRLVVQPGAPANIYAGVQQRGDTVTAKDKFRGVPGGPYLSIPLPTLSKSERDTFSMKNYPNAFIARSRNGNWMIFEPLGQGAVPKLARSKFASRWSRGKVKQEKEQALRPLAILKKSTKIKARPFLFWSPGLMETVQAIGREFIIRRWKGEVPS